MSLKKVEVENTSITENEEGVLFKKHSLNEVHESKVRRYLKRLWISQFGAL